MKTFTRLFVLALAALSIQVSLPSPAQAVTPAGHKFCENGMGSPQQLKQKILSALATDSSGTKNTLAGCKATAMHFLYAFQHTKAGSSLKTVQELPAFLDSLKPLVVKSDSEFVVSCLWDTDRGRLVKMDCETRSLRSGETIYGDEKTRELLIMSSCANPGVAELPPIVVTANPCVEVVAPSMGDKVAVRFAYIGTKPLPGKCTALLMAGETQKRFDLPEECPNKYDAVRDGRMVTIICSWDAVEVVASEKLGKTVQVQNVSGSFYTRADGMNHWYLPREALSGMFAICWELPNGEFVTLGVVREDYVRDVATITPEHVRTLRYAAN